MSAFHDNVLIGASGQQGYTISRSVRLRSSASAYFNRTFGTPTNNNVWTYSAWVKRGSVSASATPLFRVDVDANNYTFIAIDANQQLACAIVTSGVARANSITAQVFRDPSSWYHIVVVANRAEATSSNRIKMYINGVEVTAWTTTPSWDNSYSSYINASGQVHNIGKHSTTYFDGYLTEVNFIDGQALTPSSFGETDAVTGVWQPLKYTGTYGTNGFYLNFSDNSNNTAATIGKDYSGNGNNWTPNNISVTSGVTYDSMLDTPTPYADGGNGRGNYCTINPVNPPNGVTISGGNLNFACTDDTTPREAFCTIGVKTGKWYFEATKTNSCDRFYAGIVESIYKPSQGISYGKLRFDTSTSSNKTIMFAVDFSTGTYWGGVDGTWTGDPSAGTGGTSFTVGSNDWVALVGGYRETQPSAVGNINFGQRPFSYTPPTGFKALNTQNLPDATIKKGNQYFDVATQTRTGVSGSVTGIGFQPDLVWDKARGLSYANTLYDSVRGAQKELISNTTDAETTQSTGLTAFNSDGFSYGTRLGGSTPYVSWLWKESATAGFDIVTCTTNGSGIVTSTSHSLGVTPSMIILKARTGSDAWYVYHKNSTATATQGTLQLNSTAVNTTNGTSGGVDKWTVSSSAFAAGNAAWYYQTSTNHVAYLFAEVAGFSKFGSYTGNGSSDGPFVFLGFRPRWLLLKVSSAAGFDWLLYDSSRNTYNVTNLNLRPNLSDAEGSQTANNLDFLSNGFKIRGDSSGSINPAQTIIYAAFAENPFKYALAR